MELERFGFLFCTALIALGASACGGDDEEKKKSEPPPKQPESAVPLLGQDCDPIAPDYCGLPFPSNVYLQDDPANPDKKRVTFGPTTLPALNIGGARFDPAMFYDHDGFSPSQSPMAHLTLAKCTGCATPYTIEKSLEADHPTVLLEVPTGRLIPHWVDVDKSTANDGSAEDQPCQRAIMIRPAERLEDSTRYIVAMRNVDDINGQIIGASSVFSAIRDGTPLGQEATEAEKWTVYARKDLYADIFKQLEDAAGVERKSLQIAWDFTTASKENITGRMVEMRDKALAVVGADGPTFKFVKTEEAPDDDLKRRIHVVMTVPVYLDHATIEYDKKGPVDRLNIDQNGELQQNGTMDWDVLILVPNSVDGGQKHGLLQNGHGLFGSRFEGQGGYFARACNRNKYIGFSVNLFGFDENSPLLAIDGLSGRFEALKSFPERQIQGMVNQLLAMRMMMGRVAKDGIKDDQGNLVLDPKWIDNSVRGYRGDSQGGIMGGTYMTISTDVTRGLLGETGAPYNLLLNRSDDFPAYSLFLDAAYGSNGFAVQIVLGLMQMGWDRSEPSGFVPYMTEDLLPGTPKHHVIMHVAPGDHQVTTFGAHIIARAIKAPNLESDDGKVMETIFGVEQKKAPLTDSSALVEYDFGLPANPADNLPAKAGCDPHDRVRDLDPSYDQQDEFFRTGTITWKCIGLCNCNDDVVKDPTEEARCDETLASQCD